MRDIEDYVGKKVSKYLTVVGIDKNFEGKTYNSNHWIFRCDCGNKFSDIPSRVLNGHKKSCGCHKYTNSIKHGYAKDPFYHTWWSMMQRCYNTGNHNYSQYGERGIYVCAEWHDIKRFIAWAQSTVGEKKIGLTIDRIDNDGPYAPWNCRWSTPKEQASNKRNTIYLTYNGETKCVAEWASILGCHRNILYNRIKRNWSIEKILTPVKKEKITQGSTQDF